MAPAALIMHKEYIYSHTSTTDHNALHCPHAYPASSIISTLSLPISISRRRLHPIRHLWLNLHHNPQQLLDHIIARLRTRILDRLHLCIGIFLRVFFGLFIARCVLLEV